MKKYVSMKMSVLAKMMPQNRHRLLQLLSDTSLSFLTMAWIRGMLPETVSVTCDNKYPEHKNETTRQLPTPPAPSYAHNRQEGQGMHTFSTSALSSRSVRCIDNTFCFRLCANDNTSSASCS